VALPGWASLSSSVEIHAALEGIAVAFFVALVAFDVLAHLNKKRETLLERIALVCFAIAVLAEVCAYPYSRHIDTMSSEANAALNKEAGDARKEAGKAIERASKADERASKNEREAARIKKQAEGEMLARVQLQALVSARSIPPDRLRELATALRRFSGSRITLQSYINDPEGFGLSRSILSGLTEAGITVDDQAGRIMGVGAAVVGCRVSAPQSENVMAEAIAGAISRAGRLLVLSNVVTPPGSTVVVFVGIKPPFRIGQ
jgi:hypothetical protein